MGTRRYGRRIRWLLATAAGFLSATGRAEAHAAVKGLDEFASGFLHPLLTPPHVLVLLALGLLLGQEQPLRLKTPAAVFAGCAAVGLLLTTAGAVAGVYPPVLIGIGLCAGGCVALARPLPAWLRLAICAAAALAVGLDSGVEAGTPWIVAAKTLFATWMSTVLFVVNTAFYVSLLPKLRWVQTGVRVAGSWIVAIALLMLAFAIRR